MEGIRPLTEALEAKLAVENGIFVSRGSRVAVTAGGNLAFCAAVLAITDPGDEIILNAPFYFNHEMAVAMAGCRPIVAATDGEYQLQPEAIGEAITPRTRAVVTVSPNNPSGAVYPESALREVSRLCADGGIYHIHDEAYEYFTYGGARHYSPAAHAGAEVHTISLYSFSKSYGMAGWRVGYMVIPERLLEPVQKILDTLQICPPVVPQYAALGALEAGPAWVRNQVRSIAEVREIVQAELAGLGQYSSVPPSDGAFYFLIRVDSAASPMDLVERLVREHGVGVMPGSAFGMTGGCYIRVAYGALERETVVEGIGRLTRGIRAIVRD